MIAQSFLQTRRVGAVAAALVILLFVYLDLTFTSSSRTSPGYLGAGGPGRGPQPSPPSKVEEAWDLRLPPDYPIVTKPQSRFCTDRFTNTYLEFLRNHSASYCTPQAHTNLTCFHSHVPADGEADSLCVARGATLDAGSRRFGIHCPLREIESIERAKGIITFDKIRGYWYETGPANVFKKDMDFLSDPSTMMPDDQEAGTLSVSTSPRNYLLVRREGEGNPWHCLMEIWSMWMTLDVLRISLDPHTQKPFLPSIEDLGDTQVVILDDRTDGPYIDLWSLFSKYKPLRVKDLTTPISPSASLIIPLAGGSNPLWQNDWKVRDCTEASTLTAFTRRVLRMHNLLLDDDDNDEPPQDRSPDISIVFVDRKSGRRLRNQDALFEALKARVPHISVRLVDFAALSFAEQIREARGADVLVGVHGAGLTHAMWMRDGAGAVVEIQPQELDHKGFRNLALMKGLGFFRVHAGGVPEPKGADAQRRGRRRRLEADVAVNDEDGPGEARLQGRDEWHVQDVELEEDRFVEVVASAVKSLYTKGNLDYDVN